MLPPVRRQTVFARRGMNGRANVVAQTKETRESVRGFLPTRIQNGESVPPPGLCGPVVLPCQFQQFIFDGLPIRLRSDLAKPFVFKGPFVPALGPTQAVKKSVHFGLAEAGPRSIPTTLLAFVFRVIPIAAAFRIQGQFDQPQAHLDVAQDLRRVEGSREDSKFNPVRPAGQMGQVQQVVAVGVAFALGFCLATVAFDRFCVDRSFATFRSGTGEHRLLVIPDQRNQSCQGRSVSGPSHGDMQPACFIDPRALTSNLLQRIGDLLQPFGTFEFGRNEFAGLATGTRSNAPISFGSPSRRQPVYLQAVVVASNLRWAGIWNRSFEFNSEENFVCVHLVGSRSCWFRGAEFAPRDTHEPWVLNDLKPSFEDLFRNSRSFFSSSKHRPRWRLFADLNPCQVVRAASISRDTGQRRRTGGALANVC